MARAEPNAVLRQRLLLTFHLIAKVSSAEIIRTHNMPANAVGPLILFIAILLTSAHLLGYLFARLRQPRVIGEILAGILLGPFVLGRLSIYNNILQLNIAAEPKKAALDLLYQLGLLLLM
ncbi:MAG TPA: cation:proton antiporter, partial [Candidatus Angelobacter sp.]|nr:cation:proton antiporter [Candidatus Angelobacter sp.]